MRCPPGYPDAAPSGRWISLAPGPAAKALPEVWCQMDLSSLGPWSAFAILAIYLVMVAVIALIASTHPDAGRRTDARAVLDRLLRLVPGRRRR
jgi:hypothetical protein